MPALSSLFTCVRPWGERVGWLVLWVWGSACVWLPPAWADPRSLAAAPRTHLSVVIDDNYPPYIFRQQDGQLVGYLVDVWQLWQQHTGIQVQLLASDWSLAQERMARGEADVIDTLFRTPEREQHYLFSRPYADVPVAIYVHRDIGGIHDAATLRGLVVGVKAADACVRQLNSMGVTSQLAFESYEKIIAAAITGRVKVFCLDEPPANYLLYRSGAQEQFVRVFRLYEGQFHRAVRLHDAALLQQVEQGFDRISPTELASLRDKWFGTPVGSVRLDAATLRHILLALAATLLLGVLAAAWSVLLRRQVRARTRELQAERARLHTLLDMLPDLVWLKDEQGLYRACNRALEQFLGRAERDIIGHSDEQLLGPEHAALVRKLDRQALSSGEAQTVEETLFSPGLQRSTVLETIKKPLLDAQGQPIGVIGVARDITVRRAYEDAQRLAARVLECIADVVGHPRCPGPRAVRQPGMYRNLGLSAERCAGPAAPRLAQWPPRRCVLRRPVARPATQRPVARRGVGSAQKRPGVSFLANRQRGAQRGRRGHPLCAGDQRHQHRQTCAGGPGVFGAP